MSALLDLAGVKAQLNKTDERDDPELLVYIAAAVDMVEQACGPVDVRACTDTVSGTPTAAWNAHAARASTGPWILNTTPVLALTSATAGVAVVDLSALSVHLTSGVVYSTALLTPPVAISYTAGRASTPPALQLAARIICAHLWATQRGSAGRARTAGADDVVSAGAGWAIPHRAADLMRPWRLPPAIA